MTKRAIFRATTVLILVFAVSLTGRMRSVRAVTADNVPGEVLVKLLNAGDLAAVARDFHLDPAPLGQFGSRPIYRLRILDRSDPARLSALMLLDPRIVFAEPNLVDQAPEARFESSWSVGGDAGGYTAQWAGAAINLTQAQTVTRGAGITVAVLDTGIDASHPLFAGVPGRLRPGFDFVDMDGDPAEVGVAGVNPAFGHGTHVAGLVALVAPEARIMPVRVLDQNGMGNAWVLAEALKYAVNPSGNPALQDGADVINLSLSTTQNSKLVKDVLQAVTCAEVLPPGSTNLPCLAGAGRGAVVTVAAGNSASAKPEFPAGNHTSGAISIGASTQTGTLAAFSNRGSWVDVLAPGERILSSVPGARFGTWSGTSMAAPIVAGEAALMRAAAPSLSTAKIEQALVGSSTLIDGPVTRRIDAAAGVSAAQALVAEVGAGAAH